ncbi:MAG TPA: methyltransferase domain-containing protein [Nitrososphaeraceae archaeon]|nr:methyltransferase domain-containing protein [Nitrososphaeraceae archaeon]
MSSSFSSSFNGEQYKISQRKSWEIVAEGWQKWWKTFEQGAQIVNEKLVELAEIKQGDNVLDIATGIGEPAITAARKVGINGHVMATDISPQMLKIAKERAVSFGLEDIVEFKEIDAEKIDIDLQSQLQPPSFNAILCRWGLMFLPNLNLTLTNMHKLLSSGGKVAAAVWSEPSKVPKLYAAIDFVAREMGISSTITNNHSNYAKTLSPFNLANINIVKEALVEAGFKDIHIEHLNVIFEFESAKDYTNFAKEIIAPLQDMLANETEKRREEIWEALAEEIRKKYVLINNNNNNKEYNKSVRMNNETICIVGRKP